MIVARLFLIILPAMMMVGCAHRSQDVPPPTSRPLAGEFEAYHAPAKPSEAGEVKIDEPTGPITLRQALALALLHSPELAGASWEVRAAEARRLQAGLLPNPALEMEMENFGGTGRLRGFGAAETTLALGQLIELGGKRMKRTRLAALERDLAAWDYEAKRMDVYAQTTRAFVDLLASQQRAALAEELTRLTQQMFDTASARVASGSAAPLEQHKAQVELGARKLDLERARRQAEALRKRLAAAWGATEARFARADGEFEAVAAIPSAEQLAALVSHNPDIARWKTEMEQRQAALALQRAKALGDVTVRGGVKRLEEIDDTGFVVGVSVPLGIFDRNQGGIRESLYKLEKAAQERRFAEARAYSNLADAYQLLASSFAEVNLLKQDILPAARQAFDSAAEGYRQGKNTYLDMLDAQRTLSELRGDYIASLAAYHRAAADVERLVGQDLKSLTTPK